MNGPADRSDPATAGLARLNGLPRAAAEAELLQCCGSRTWARAMAARRPFPGADALLRAADAVWMELEHDDWLEAFRAHPRIGERKPAGAAAPDDGVNAARDPAAAWAAEEAAGTTAAGEGGNAARDRAAAASAEGKAGPAVDDDGNPARDRSAAWSAEEQAGAAAADDRLKAALAAGNREYEERFGHIYIVCATSRSAGEMLALLRERLGNDPARELEVAAEEQRKITALRLRKFLAGRGAHGEGQ